MLLSFEILAFILCTIRPRLYSLAMLFIIFPITNIGGTIGVFVATLAVGFVVFPLALVDITISVDELAVAVCLVLPPLSFIF